MTLQQLRYFVSVAQKLSFSRAAEQHYISQTAVSQQIKLLEQELGAALFERTHRWVRLTPAGKIYYEYACQILYLVELAGQKARAAANATEQPLELSIMHGLENTALIDRLLEFQAQEPGISFQFHRGSFEELRRAVQEKRTRLALVIEIHSLQGQPGIRQFSLGQMQNYAVLNRQSHLAHCERLTQSQLQNEQFRTAMLAPDSWTLFSHILECSGLRTENAAFADSLESVLLQIAFHGGYTILAEPVLHQLSPYKNLVCLPLEGDCVSINLLWNESDEDPALHKLLRWLGAEG